MTIRTRYRTVVAAAAVALVAPLALVAITATPANAAVSKHKHEVTTYKVEKYVKLAGGGYTSPSGDVLTTSLTCSSGNDHVLDGMWWVQHVDQYQPPPTAPNDPDDDTGFPPDNPTPYTGGIYDDERDVQVWESYPDLSNDYQWDFKLENFAWGDAQVKLFITCVKGSTEGANNHSHPVNVSHAVSTGEYSTAADRNELNMNSAYNCSAGNQYLVAPGFKILDTNKSRLLSSFPTSSGLSWRWDFASNAPSSIRLYRKCIDRQVGVANASGGNHRHAIAMKNLPDYSGHPYSIHQGNPETVKFSCDEDVSDYHGYKAAVGWFWMGGNWEHNWFLGMEPQPKSRVFHFGNWHPFSANASITIGALCINSRTGNPYTV